MINDVTEELADGRWGRVVAIKPDFLKTVVAQADSVESVLDAFPDDSNQLADFSATCQHLANEGRLLLKKKFRYEKDGICAIKIRGKQKQMYRFPCFQLKNNWIVLFGFEKERKPKWNQKYFNWAGQLVNALHERVEDGDQR